MARMKMDPQRAAPPAIEIGPAAEGDLEQVRELLREYAAWVDDDVCFGAFDDEVASLPGAYAPPDGGLWLARTGAVAVGMVALRFLDAQPARRAELKRLWVRPAHRGHGLGRALTLTAIDEARVKGYVAICLDTLERMSSARAMYISLGFRPIAPYNERRMSNLTHFELALPPSAEAGAGRIGAPGA